MIYKVGDKVRIKGTDIGGIIKEIKRGQYVVQISHSSQIMVAWPEDLSLIEGLVKESDDFEKMYMESEKRYEEEYSKGEYCHEQSFKWGFQEGYNYAHENEKLEINLKNGYEFKDENGNVINATKIVLKKKKKEYPKTYEECIGKLPINWDGKVEGYKCDLLITFQKLLICRDTYWKIAGDEMGLGKPWEPDSLQQVFSIGRVGGTLLGKVLRHDGNTTILEFPTKEMRDAFYENFKEEIESVKELL